MSLDQSLALAPTGEGEWRAHGDPNYEAGTGMFGGWTAALLLKAVLSDARAQGEPVTLNVNYVSRVDPKGALNISARPIGGSRSVTTWQVELRNEGEENVATLATVIMALRRESVGFTEHEAPEAPAPETLPMFHPPAPFGQRTDVRPVAGYPPFSQPDTRALHWAREISSAPLDHVRLAYLADCYPPRMLPIGTTWRMSSTLTMAVYFYATREEMAAASDGYVLSEVTGTRAAASTCGSWLNMWSRTGALMATSEQMCWFK